MELVIILLFLPAAFVLIEFLLFVMRGGRRYSNRVLRWVAEISSLIILPGLYLSLANQNDCCGQTAAFSPRHSFTITVFIVIALICYFYCSFRRSIATPILEVLVNAGLIIGLAISVTMLFHVEDSLALFLGAAPIVLLGLMMLAENQKLVQQTMMPAHFSSRAGKMAWRILSAKILVKFPLLLLVCIPVFLAVTLFLLLFGQKPDSAIRVFTETYRHGLSQWDYQCENVICGGHYLCSVAANGHPAAVKPLRLGIRKGRYIVCNRQLLVANAFEELLQERMPLVHRRLRANYNKVGNVIHRYYDVFSVKWFADLIYFLMKPLEWFFVFVLYLCDRRPENRIGRQYLGADATHLRSL